MKGRRVLNIGNGSAGHLQAIDVDSMAAVAARLNALENEVAFAVEAAACLDHLSVPKADLPTVGDFR